MKTINWINKTLNTKYNGKPLGRIVKDEYKIKPIPDGLESWLTDGEQHSLILTKGKYDGLGINRMKILECTTLVKLNNQPDSFLPFKGDEQRYIAVISKAELPNERGIQIKFFPRYLVVIIRRLSLFIMMFIMRDRTFMHIMSFMIKIKK